MKALELLLREGFLSVADVELGRGLARMGGESRDEMALTVALLSRNLENGHVCLALGPEHAAGLETDSPVGMPLPTAEAMLDLARTSQLVSQGDGEETDGRPLVLDTKGRLYLARYHDHERALAGHLRRLAQAEIEAPPLAPAGIDALFPPRADGKVDLQRVAALAARTRKLSVILGGPGTGKTSTVVKLLCLLVEDARAAHRAAPRVCLVAPTGKAAQRLTESIEQARARLRVAPEVANAIPSAAQTVHRALGSIDGSITQFRHHRGRRLECDVLLLDEASMVDLALMRRLFDALPDHARVILLGDEGQLVAVEAGGVLSDLCQAAERGGPIRACVTRLTESHRYAAGSGIAALAEAIRAGQSARALALLEDADFRDIVLHGGVSLGQLPPSLLRDARRAYAALQTGSLEHRLTALGRFRVLAAHRKGQGGVESINLALTHALGHRNQVTDHFRGRPVLITQNDYGSELFNGDVGLIDRGEQPGTLALYMNVGSGTRRVALGRLPGHETVYAMSVHKSQGSEFDRVAFVLPERPSPVLTRELLFTAITRAREQVTLYGSPELIRGAIERRTLRQSGLADRLVD